MARPLLIWGAGAVGGSIGACLVRAGAEVLLVDADVNHVAQCNRIGLTVEGPVTSFTVPVTAVTPEHLQGTFERIVLAVKAQHTPVAAAQLRAHLTDDGFVLSAQNGLNEFALEQLVGRERTMGAFVNFGADWLAPGRILYGNRGAVVIGELDGSIRQRTTQMHATLQQFEPDAQLSTDVLGYLWGKVGYGAMLFATALCNDSMSENFRAPEREIIWVTLAREAMAVARSQAARPKGFNGFDPAAFAPEATDTQASACIAALAQFTAHTAKTHSGIWRDLAVRKRPTEAPGFLTPVLELARNAGIATPAIGRLAQLIGEVERGEAAQSLETLMRLETACR